jgi:hypothetical protein
MSVRINDEQFVLLECCLDYLQHRKFIVAENGELFELHEGIMISHGYKKEIAISVPIEAVINLLKK